MAIVKDNILLQMVRGTIANQVTIYERNGQTIMAKKRGKSNKKPTARQLEARKKMTQATARALLLLQDPELEAYYASLAGPGQNAYNMAVKDAYHSPDIQHIRLEDKQVVVTAKDQFRVAEVKVQVIDADGVIAHSGSAVLGRNGVDWHYKFAALPASGTIIAIAVDLPGNETVQELLIE
ncbi:hypothetical protein [Chitinophaga rhizophila]|uniref:Uncharacterized protein n=1 Tax=Chitinophaga rhizophila TaxID=2866212 RepID=A0ABS7GD32_9BACT|nr:hypothetical protein [Chitinophaga rhizophila]MBW8685584.1 hypothetical protein [Chitinophaga rhizophila]